MRDKHDPETTRLDLNPAEPLPPAPPGLADDIVEEGVENPDSGRIRAVTIVCTIINVVCAVFAVVLAVHILLVLGSANMANGFASFVDDWAANVNLGLRDLFVPDNQKLATLYNEGIAAIAWLLIAAVLTYLIRRLALPSSRRLVRYRRVVR